MLAAPLTSKLAALIADVTLMSEAPTLKNVAAAGLLSPITTLLILPNNTSYEFFKAIDVINKIK